MIYLFYCLSDSLKTGLRKNLEPKDGATMALNMLNYLKRLKIPKMEALVLQCVHFGQKRGILARPRPKPPNRPIYKL